MLFSMVASFTYANFRLAGPPYFLTPGQQGWVFTVYLLGLVTTPLGTRLTLRFGRLPTLVASVGLACCGIGLTTTVATALVILTQVGTFLGFLSFGFVADWIGRRRKPIAIWSLGRDRVRPGGTGVASRVRYA